MPRRTGYKTNNALSTLRLGDPDLGTKAWDTEYDVEFCEVPRREEQDRLEEVKESARSSLRTPRSLKKGYVSEYDYDKLGDQYNNALEAYRDVQLQVAGLEHRMAAMQGNEHLLLQAVDEQNNLINTLKQQVAVMTESVGQLLGGVERNKSLLTAMNNAQEASPYKPARVVQALHSNEMHDATSVLKRLEALEAKISDMANAVVALSRAQELMSRPFTPAGHRTGGGVGDGGREGPAGRRSEDGRRSNDGHRGINDRRSNNGQDYSVSGRRRLPVERIERMPASPYKLATKSTFWKP